MEMNLQTDKHDRSNVFSVAKRFTVHIPITNTQTLPTMTTRCVNWSQANIWVNDVLPGSASRSGHQEVTKVYRLFKIHIFDLYWSLSRVLQ
jgi:hypothetical protein